MRCCKILISLPNNENIKKEVMQAFEEGEFCHMQYVEAFVIGKFSIRQVLFSKNKMRDEIFFGPFHPKKIGMNDLERIENEINFYVREGQKTIGPMEIICREGQKFSNKVGLFLLY